MTYMTTAEWQRHVQDCVLCRELRAALRSVRQQRIAGRHGAMPAHPSGQLDLIPFGEGRRVKGDTRR